MDKKEYVILKLSGLLATILYGWSSLWITLIYLYGGMYVPFRELGLRNSVYFQIFVFIISVVILGVVLLKLTGATFWKLLVQNIILIVFSVPLFALLFGIFNDDFESMEAYIGMFILTMATININDWIKINKASH